MMLDRHKAQLVLVDLQTALLPRIRDQQAVLAVAKKMARAAAALGLPITVTEQYPEGLGRTHAGLLGLPELQGIEPIVKLHFSCARNKAFREILRRRARQQVVLAGIEAHVCVQQTALDLLTDGYDVFVCADAVGSRAAIDYDMAVARMRQAGAIVTTTETAIFELLGRAGTDEFRQILSLVKQG
jgi:nicotinamidase-related amidase